MPIEIIVPRLGWSMDEGTFAGWLIPPGEMVSIGDALFLLEGEKATQDVESFDGGVLCVPADAPQSGDTVKVGQVIGYLIAADESAPTRIGAKPSPPPSPLSATTSTPDTIDVALPPQTDPPQTDPPAPTSGTLGSAGPSVRRLARELGVDLPSVPGTGPRGRVVSADVRQAARQPTPHPQPTPQLVNHASTSGHRASPRARRLARQQAIGLERVQGTGRHGRIRERDVRAALVSAERPPSKLRQVIAKRMLAGVQEAAPVTLHRKVRATELVRCREAFKQAPINGIVPTFNDCLLRLSCAALLQHHALNAVWRDEQLQPSSSVHLAFGVDTPAGLLAPVIHDAEQCDLEAIARSARQLIDAARNGTTRERDLIGGTFTVTNLGNLGVDAFTPILNLPQVAILGVGRIVEEPVIEQGAIVAGRTLQLSLTFDHRALDGATAARFLQTLAEMMEAPTSWLSAGHPSR